VAFSAPGCSRTLDFNPMNGPVVDSRTFRIGFLAALETDDGAFVAGLLVTNRYGRPLEFQCTSPVRPTHAQKLLYGETLRPFLLGELMGRALLDRLGSPPDLLVTDNDDILDLRHHIAIPMARVEPLADEAGSATTAPPLGRVRMGRRILSIHSAHETDIAALHHGATQVTAETDLQEPLERVRQALAETLQGQQTGNPGGPRS